MQKIIEAKLMMKTLTHDRIKITSLKDITLIN